MKRLCSLLITVIVCIGPSVVADAQCNVNTTNRSTATGLAVVYKIFSPAAQCQLASYNSISFCSPSVAATHVTTFLLATAPLTATNAYCVWNCVCPGSPSQSITIDGGNGLPVELLELRIE